MSGDNRVFNVNGVLDDGGKELLKAALELAFQQNFSDRDPQFCRACGYRISNKYGFVLYWTDHPEVVKFPVPLNAAEVFPIVVAYLDSNPQCELSDWDKNADHDGSNGRGWRVYCEDWGHVGSDWAAFLAIKPAFIWYGK